MCDTKGIPNIYLFLVYPCLFTFFFFWWNWILERFTTYTREEDTRVKHFLSLDKKKPTILLSISFWVIIMSPLNKTVITWDDYVDISLSLSVFWSNYNCTLTTRALLLLFVFKLFPRLPCNEEKYQSDVEKLKKASKYASKITYEKLLSFLGFGHAFSLYKNSKIILLIASLRYCTSNYYVELF